MYILYFEKFNPPSASIARRHSSGATLPHVILFFFIQLWAFRVSSGLSKTCALYLYDGWIHLYTVLRALKIGCTMKDRIFSIELIERGVLKAGNKNTQQLALKLRYFFLPFFRSFWYSNVFVYPSKVLELIYITLSTWVCYTSVTSP